MPGDAWLDTLPETVDALLDGWDLEWTGEAWSGHCSLVLPVTRDGDRLALKVTWPHPEGLGEHLGLRAWDGNGIVRMVATDPTRGCLLLERLDETRTLDDLWAHENGHRERVSFCISLMKAMED